MLRAAKNRVHDDQQKVTSLQVIDSFEAKDNGTFIAKLTADLWEFL
jgi:hypothetical protein